MPAGPLLRSASSWGLRSGSLEVRERPSGRTPPLQLGTDLGQRCKAFGAQAQESSSQRQPGFETCIQPCVYTLLCTCARTHTVLCTQPGSSLVLSPLPLLYLLYSFIIGQFIGADVMKQKSLFFPSKGSYSVWRDRNSHTGCPCWSVTPNLHHEGNKSMCGITPSFCVFVCKILNARK